MRHLYSWIADHPRLGIGFAIGLSLALSTGIARLRFDASLENLFHPGDPEVEYYRNVRANFGGEAFISVTIRAEDVFQPEVLETLGDLELGLSQLEGIEAVSGLLALDSFRRKAGALVSLPALEDPDPDTDEGLSSRRQEYLSDPLVRNWLINESGTAASIYILPAFDAASREGESLAADLLSRIDRVLEETANPGLSHYVLGSPIVTEEATRHIDRDLKVLGPVAMLICGVILFLFFQSYLASFLPLLTGVLSAAATLGFMGYADIAINPILSTIVLLILVMGCTEDAHLFAEYDAGIRRGLSSREAVRAMRTPVASAVFLTAATTTLGFLSLAPVPVAGLRDFAYASAAGMALNFVITLLLVPSIFQFCSPGKILNREKPSLESLQKRLRHSTHGSLLKTGSVLGIAVAVFALGVTRLQIDTDYLCFFSEDSRIGRAYANFQEDFGGKWFFVVAVETHRKNGVLDPENYEAIADLHDFLQQRFHHASGLVSFHRHFEDRFTRESVPHGIIPGRLLMLNAALKYQGFPAFIDHDGSRTVIHVRSPHPGTKGMRRTEREILRYVREEMPDAWAVRVTGEGPLISRFSDRVTTHLIRNLLALFFIAGLLLSLYFRSIRTGLISLIPNLLPVLAVFGTMGWLGIPLGTGTFPVAIVALGIAVDDTIHFIARYFSERKRASTTGDALAKSLSKELRPVLTTSLALAAGFLVNLSSPFVIHQHMGFLFAVAILTALIADLMVTPFLIRIGGLRSPSAPSRDPSV